MARSPITEETVWHEVWPIVQQVIQATLAEDEAALRRYLVPGGTAAALLQLFGPVAFDIVLKTVLNREKLSLSRVVETESGRYLYLEYAWPNPATPGRLHILDFVTLQLQRPQWRIVSINPAPLDDPLTATRARALLLSDDEQQRRKQIPNEPWVLPLALFAGVLQLPLQERGLRDAVEQSLLPRLQQRAYEVMALIGARRLWRDFYEKARPSLEYAALWAAAVEYHIGQQSRSDVTEAAVAHAYGVNIVPLSRSSQQIKETLSITGIDERYSSLWTNRVSGE